MFPKELSELFVKNIMFCHNDSVFPIRLMVINYNLLLNITL